MSMADALAAFRETASRIRELRGARGEQSLYGPFRDLLNTTARALGHAKVLVVDQVTEGSLIPDYGVFRGDAHVGWVELKAPNKDLDNLRGHDAEQFERAKSELEWFVISNAWDWRLFENGRQVVAFALPANYLRTGGRAHPTPPGGRTRRTTSQTPTPRPRYSVCSSPGSRAATI